jgi:hypothetical protein
MLKVAGVVPSWNKLQDVLSFNLSLADKCTVVFSMSRETRYYLMIDRGAIHSLPPELCLCEVVVDDTARPFVDFDQDVHKDIDSIDAAIRTHFMQTYSMDVTVKWKWSYKETRRWHCIVSGVYFYRCWTQCCIRMMEHVSTLMNGLEYDASVYRSNSCLRMVTQCKYEDGEYIKRLYPHEKCHIDALFITPNDNDKRIEQREGVAPKRNIEHIDIHSSFQVPRGLVAIDAMEGLVRLKRIYPSICPLCKRLHTSENAYVIIRGGTAEFRCYRNVQASLTYGTL